MKYIYIHNHDSATNGGFIRPLHGFYVDRLIILTGNNDNNNNKSNNNIIWEFIRELNPNVRINYLFIK